MKFDFKRLRKLQEGNRFLLQFGDIVPPDRNTGHRRAMD